MAATGDFYAKTEGLRDDLDAWTQELNESAATAFTNIERDDSLDTLADSLNDLLDKIEKGEFLQNRTANIRDVALEADVVIRKLS